MRDVCRVYASHFGLCGIVWLRDEDASGDMVVNS